MPKRVRRSSAEIVQVNTDGTAVVEYNGRQYYWHIPDCVSLNKITDVNEYDITIVHNSENRAMLDIVEVRSEDIFLRQEVNPLSHKDVQEWVIDG